MAPRDGPIKKTSGKPVFLERMVCISADGKTERGNFTTCGIMAANTFLWLLQHVPARVSVELFLQPSLIKIAVYLLTSKGNCGHSLRDGENILPVK